MMASSSDYQKLWGTYQSVVNTAIPIEHILCWAHVRAKFVYASDISKQEEAESFIEDIGYLYSVENEIIASHLTPEQIKKRRNKSDVSETLRRLYKRAEVMLADKLRIMAI